VDEKQELLRLLAAAAAGDDPAGRALGPAARAAGRFAPAQAGAVRAALQTALLSAAPDCAYVPVRAGCFAAFGLSEVRFALPLASLPDEMLLRWWGFLRGCGARSAEVVRALGFAPAFGADLDRLDALYFAPPPADFRALKQQLRAPLPADAGRLLRAFAAFDSRFAARAALYEQLAASGEAYTLDRLAIRPSSLRALGVREKRVPAVMELLLDAVIRAPQLNEYQTLAGLARSLEGLL